MNSGIKGFCLGTWVCQSSPNNSSNVWNVNNNGNFNNNNPTNSNGFRPDCSRDFGSFT